MDLIGDLKNKQLKKTKTMKKTILILMAGVLIGFASCKSKRDRENELMLRLSGETVEQVDSTRIYAKQKSNQLQKEIDELEKKRK